MFRSWVSSSMMRACAVASASASANDILAELKMRLGGGGGGRAVGKHEENERESYFKKNREWEGQKVGKWESGEAGTIKVGKDYILAVNGCMLTQFTSQSGSTKTHFSYLPLYLSTERKHVLMLFNQRMISTVHCSTMSRPWYRSSALWQHREAKSRD